VLVNESEWLIKAQRGDPEAFTCLLEAYQRPVFNLCYRMLGNAQDAEDAAQETFLRAYQHLKRYDNSRPFSTWLLSIAAHYGNRSDPKAQGANCVSGRTTCT